MSLRNACLVGLASLILAGCGPSRSSGPSATSPVSPAPIVQKAKSSSPYTREYYRAVGLMPVKQMKDKVRIGMTGEEVTTVLGRPLRFGGNPTDGTVEYFRQDGWLKVIIAKGRVSKLEVKPPKPAS